MAKSKIQQRVSRPTAAPIEVKMDTLIQGVSQQPPHIRASGQGTEQINGWSSPVEGLTKRNPTRYTGKMLDNSIKDFFLDIIEVSTTETYSIVVMPNDPDSETDHSLRLEVWQNLGALSQDAVNVHGTGFTYELKDGTPGWKIDATTNYFSNEDAKKANELYKGYVIASSGQISLITNRNKVTAFTADKTNAIANEGLVFIQAVAYSITYTLYDGDTKLCEYSTPKADADDNQISTDAVAKGLFDNLPDTYEGELNSYVFYLKKKDGSAMNLRLTDSRSNTLARAFTKDVTSIASLPLIAKDGYRVLVVNDPTTDVDDLWLQFSVLDSANAGKVADGSWAECPAPGTEYKLDSNTMPFVIYRAGSGKLFIGPADGTEQSLGDLKYTFPQWAERTAGNKETNPDPEFIGSPIRDHALFRQRYTVLGGESIVFSEVDDAFNFFLDTAQAFTASDTFSLRCQSEVSTPLEWMLPVDDTVLTFSATSQFQVRAADGDVLTPQTGLVIRLSNINMNTSIRPKKAGAQVLFPSVEYGFTHFREYQFFNASQRRLGLNLGGSNDTMQNVPKYLPGIVTHFDVGEAVDFAVASSPNNRRILYVYKYLWTGGEGGIQKVQASWSKWEFDGEVRWFKFIDNILYILLDDDDGLHLIEYFADEIETEDSVQPHLDRLLLFPDCNNDGVPSNDVTATYDETKDKTTFVLPYTPKTKVVAGVRYIETAGQSGLILGESETKTIVCDEDGDFTNEKVFFGEAYKFAYTFTKAFVPEQNQARNTLVGNLEGRTQVLTWQINHYNTGYYQVRVSRLNRPADTVHTYRARNLGVTNTSLDVSDFLASGSYRVPVYCRNLEVDVTVESDNHLPVVLSSAAWEGAYSNRSKAVN